MSWAVYDSSTYAAEDFEAWLKKFKPTNPDTAQYAWIAVRGTATAQGKAQVQDENAEGANELDVVTQACEIAEKLAIRCKEINDDPNIPTRGNKKNGTISKKETREKEHAQAATRLKNLAISHHFTVGKWLFFPSPENVVEIWQKIARAIVAPEGHLKECVHSAKVSPYTPEVVGEKPPTHVICVYVEDGWNTELVGRVFEILAVRLGLTSNAYKADLYTMAGLDSKHPSGMKSTLYNAKDFFTPEEITSRREEWKAAHPDPNAPPASAPKPAKTLVKAKAKGTGFVDDSDDDHEEEGKKKEGKEEEDGSATEPEEDDAEAPKSKKVKK